MYADESRVRAGQCRERIVEWRVQVVGSDLVVQYLPKAGVAGTGVIGTTGVGTVAAP